MHAASNLHCTPGRLRWNACPPPHPPQACLVFGRHVRFRLSFLTNAGERRTNGDCWPNASGLHVSPRVALEAQGSHQKPPSSMYMHYALRGQHAELLATPTRRISMQCIVLCSCCQQERPVVVSMDSRVSLVTVGNRLSHAESARCSVWSPTHCRLHRKHALLSVACLQSWSVSLSCGKIPSPSSDMSTV